MLNDFDHDFEFFLDRLLPALDGLFDEPFEADWILLGLSAGDSDLERGVSEPSDPS